MAGPAAGADVLDAETPPGLARGPRSWRWTAAIATVLVLATLAVVRGPQEAPAGVALSLTGHSGSALDGQQFVRLYFSLSASGGDADVEQVEMVLGGRRQDGVAPGHIDDGAGAKVLVDVVPDCPRAIQELPVGTLEVTFRAGGTEQVAHLPLPIEGSLPRLVLRRCAQQDRV